MKNVKRNGFTLAEMLVTIGIISFVSVVMLSVLKNAKPNQELLMFKKAYSLTGRSVAELVNDEDFYPEKAEGSQYFGNTDLITYKGKEYQGNTKFCELFAEKLNLKSDTNCSDKTFKDGQLPDGQFTTADGMVWILPITDFSSDSEYYSIYIDTNGKKGNNCFYDKDTCEKPDRFTILVRQDGKIRLDGEKEREYMETSDITKDSN